MPLISNKEISISFSCNHTQTHILALNLKKIFPVIKFWTMICHTVCVHRTVLCGFKSDFFFCHSFIKMSTSYELTRWWELQGTFQISEGIGQCLPKLVTTKMDSVEEDIFPFPQICQLSNLAHGKSREPMGKGKQTAGFFQTCQKRDSGEIFRHWNSVGKWLIYKSQFILGKSLCSTTLDISKFADL